MHWTVFLYAVLLYNTTTVLTINISTKDLKLLIKLLKRRNTLENDNGIVGEPKSVENIPSPDLIEPPKSAEDLPPARPIKPGHTLIQPSRDMLKSAAKYPHADSGSAVYGNLENLGITFGKTNQRLLYGNFRKSSDVLVALLRAIENIQARNKRTPNVVVIKLSPSEFESENKYQISDEKKAEIDNNASEELDDFASGEIFDTRRRSHSKKNGKFRDRGNSTSSSSEDSSSRSSDYERNPGNPFTVHKDKYKQNWLWNHFMDGDHMNLNPYAPKFSNAGPSGASLFFGRKWWYFNQDDFKPLN